ncbi:MAG: cytidylate kinase-like family protein [Deltaproteobacteria bacterium]|nr:MAG: cytidylate kinase-like family protein [Deltaproteobacteria bacterium]
MKIRNPNLQIIIESHINEWFIKEKDKLERKKKKRPLILISRQRGAGGLSVAERLSKKLGWPYYDKNIIKEIAETMGVDERHLEFLDERDRNIFQEFTNVFRRDPEVSQDEYVQYLKRFMKTLGEVGGSIILGRGANFILSPHDALRVRLVGDPDTRARFSAQKYGLKEKEAIKLLDKWDREQRNFIKRYYGENIDDPLNYDLVINTTHLDVDGTLELTMAAYKRKFPGVL